MGRGKSASESFRPEWKLPDRKQVSKGEPEGERRWLVDNGGVVTAATGQNAEGKEGTCVCTVCNLRLQTKKHNIDKHALSDAHRKAVLARAAEQQEDAAEAALRGRRDDMWRSMRERAKPGTLNQLMLTLNTMIHGRPATHMESYPDVLRRLQPPPQEQFTPAHEEYAAACTCSKCVRSRSLGAPSSSTQLPVAIATKHWNDRPPT